MTDYQTAAELAQEQCEHNAHIRANEEAERRWIIEAERTAANGGFSPAEDYDYRPCECTDTKVCDFCE